MIPNDTGPDAELLRRLSALGREDALPSHFTDRVVVDLERRGLVRRAVGSPTIARWWAVAAAAVVTFAAGMGVGVALRGGRGAPQTSPPAAGATADRAGNEINVPRVGQTEVWF